MTAIKQSTSTATQKMMEWTRFAHVENCFFSKHFWEEKCLAGFRTPEVLPDIAEVLRGGVEIGWARNRYPVGRCSEILLKKKWRALQLPSNPSNFWWCHGLGKVLGNFARKIRGGCTWHQMLVILQAISHGPLCWQKCLEKLQRLRLGVGITIILGGCLRTLQHPTTGRMHCRRKILFQGEGFCDIWCIVPSHFVVNVMKTIVLGASTHTFVVTKLLI